MDVSTDANDTQQLQTAMERFFASTGRWPDQVIANKGYAARQIVEILDALGTKLIAP